jgi:polyketide-type polyunsaturated fatty acid synthase PfaA
VQEELPGLPELNPEDLAELRTLGQIVDYMKSKAGSVSAGAPAGAKDVSPLQSAPAASTANVADLQPIVLAIVGEKTGYPVEMLELDMDMEADLGIDSIKRVEILSAVQERVPGLPEFNPDVLAEFRTLQQIVDAMSHTQANAPATAAPKAAPTYAPAPSATVVVKKLAQPDQVAVTLPKASLCLINDDGSSAVTPLISQLQKQGWEVAVLQWPLALSPRTAKLPSNVKAVNVAEATEAGLQAAIETVAQTIGNIAALIHLQPARSIKGIEYPDASRDLLRLVFLQAKHLKVALNEAAASGGRAAFITVSRIDGQLGWKGGDSDLLQAGLFGLTKTAYHEWPNVFCRAIDADPKFDGEALAKAIVAELWDADRRISEVGLSPSKDGANERVTLVAQETDSYAQAPGKSISKDSVFLVSGGAKGVTTACVAALARNFGGKYILMGRSELLAAEPAWSAGITNEAELKKRAMGELTAKGDKPTPVKVQQFLRPILSSREISQALQAIRAAGGEAEYVAGDVTDAAGIKSKLATITAKLGKITGIVHGAGVLADRLIEQKTVKDFDAVYGTKIDGLAAMLACVDQKALTHFVMFSSAAGFYGNVGQSDYAIANDILNKTSVRFKQLNPSAQCLAFDWGPWDGGMVTPELKRMFTERGVYIIPLEAGAQLFASEVGASANRCPQIVVGNEMQGAGQEGTPAKKLLASRLSRVISRTANPFVEHHVIGGNPVMPTVAMIGWMATGCEALFAGYHYAGLRNYRLFKGIVFDGTEPAVVHMDANPGEDANGEVVVKVQIYSDNNGKRVNHYGADVVLNAKLPAAPGYANAFAKAGGAATASYGDGTLFHGELLQGITDELEFSDKRLVLGCTITAPASAQQGQFMVGSTNLFADDLLFQAMLVWARKQYSAGSLPSSVVAFEQFRVAQPGERCFIVVDVIRHSEKALVADVTMVASDGAVISRFKSAEVTISASLNTLFKPAANG